MLRLDFQSPFQKINHGNIYIGTYPDTYHFLIKILACHGLKSQVLKSEIGIGLYYGPNIAHEIIHDLNS